MDHLLLVLPIPLPLMPRKGHVWKRRNLRLSCGKTDVSWKGEIFQQISCDSSFPTPTLTSIKVHIDFICQDDAKLFDLLILDGHAAFQSEVTSSTTSLLETFLFPGRPKKSMHLSLAIWITMTGLPKALRWCNI